MTVKTRASQHGEPVPAAPAAPKLDRETKLRLLRLILESRHGDLRQESLNRQGKGHFHVAGMGHEGLAALGVLLTDGDYMCPYYRDRGLVLGRGVTTADLALDYFAKRDSSSGGRQMPAHYSYPARKIWSVPTPTGSQLLPACGIAWGLQLDGKKDIVVTCIGDASSRQGDFYEAIGFATERKLPVLFIVEDNEYGISTPTHAMNPLALNLVPRENWAVVDGSDVEAVHAYSTAAIARLRAGGGPELLWLKVERLSSHTSSDDHKLYRSADDIARLADKDPVLVLKKQMIAAGQLTEAEFEKLDNEIKESVRRAYAEAEKAENPRADDLEAHVFTAHPELDVELLKPGKYRLGDIINLTLRNGLKADGRRVIFGEDIEDPKGGVFRLTRGLSTDFPKQVFNSPLAESTILGVACGLASYGRRPVFEVQFIDFIYPGWNQLVTNLATLRWRTNGKWTCPAVIYAPYGAYLPGGSLWHSQANEAAIAHFPGINVVIPSTPEDAAGLLWTSMHAEDPVIFLLPKHLLWAEREVSQPISAIPIGLARKRREGTDVTVVAWGNTMERSLEALQLVGGEVSVDLIDLRSIVPWDRAMIEESVRKTGRLVVVQEDTENCSVGQMIISHICGRPDVFGRMVSPPILVSKGNVMIGYNPIYEYAALPGAEDIAAALRRAVAGTMERGGLSLPVRTAASAAPAKSGGFVPIGHDAPNGSAGAKAAGEVIRVPIMGEGIRTARVVALLKQPGDAVKPDDTLCEVETEKAVYPIEASSAGTFVGWQVKLDETVEIGQIIGALAPEGIDWRTVTVEAAVLAATVAPQVKVAAAALAGAAATEEGAPVGAIRREAVLSPAITRRLEPVIPATIELMVQWAAIRDARQLAKERDPATAPSPSAMVSWGVVRVMERHPQFRRLVLNGSQIYELQDFELGVAVALEGDKLATAVIPRANRHTWAEFTAEYAKAIEAARTGKLTDIRAPLLISSLGGFGVRAGIPIVVPPAMGTLFIGTSHHEMVRTGNSFKAAEVVTLSLTFDHRVVNGGGAALFMQDLRKTLESFQLPAAVEVTAAPA